MATFEAQVEGLTSLSIDGSSSPTQTELTQFLTDGAKEVINHLPDNLLDLCKEEKNFTSVLYGNETQELTTGKISDVVGNNFYPARKVSKAKARLLGYEAYLTSLGVPQFATIDIPQDSDPVYYIAENKINGIPRDKTFRYSEVQYPAVAYGDSSITLFPDEAEYLVVLYASCKSLQNAMGAMKDSIVHSGQGGTYAAPTDLNLTSPTGSQGWEQVRHWIEREEDNELAQVQVTALSAELQQFVAEYQWYQGQQTKLQQDYDKGLQAIKGGK